MSGEIPQLGIMLPDQLKLFGSRPTLQLFFARDRLEDRGEVFHEDETVQIVTGSETVGIVVLGVLEQP